MPGASKIDEPVCHKFMALLSLMSMVHTTHQSLDKGSQVFPSLGSPSLGSDGLYDHINSSKPALYHPNPLKRNLIIPFQGSLPWALMAYILVTATVYFHSIRSLGSNGFYGR